MTEKFVFLLDHPSDCSTGDASLREPPDVAALTRRMVERRRNGLARLL